MTEHEVVPGAPVVGMVGAGQLARMTGQAAVSLGIGFRVLAAAPDESAALVFAGTQIGDHLSLDDLTAFWGGCGVGAFRPGTGAGPARGGVGGGGGPGPAGPRRVWLRPGQARHARAVGPAGHRMPAVRPRRGPRRRGGLRRRYGMAGR